MGRSITIFTISLVTGIFLGRFASPSTLIESAKASPIVGHTKLEEPKEEFSKDSVIMFMKKLNIKYLEFSYAQAELETGNFTSTIFKENKNLYGMKKSYQRPTTTDKENRNHAKYSSWKESVIDFAIFQARVLAKTKNKDEYMAYIAKFYSENNHYLDRVNKIVEDNRECGLF